MSNKKKLLKKGDAVVFNDGYNIPLFGVIAKIEKNFC